ncbi:DUF853 family protein [Candidatus Micrarchaeota archaeon]|nr:DUF853 family protein [Candidatus Micrarchaeota archaeon]
MDFVGESKEQLDVLEDGGNLFIGRKKSVHREFGREGALLIGRSADAAGVGKHVFLDSISPHVVFICGSRGTGKSFSAGVIAEELVLRNPNVACIVVDPVGIFWSLRYPNKEDAELRKLEEWGLDPSGIEKTSVFIPEGQRTRVPKETFDRTFSLRASELTVDDWCLTFGIDRFSPIGLLLDKVVEKTRERRKNYGLEDMLYTIEKDKDFSSRERGFKQDTRRALASRLDAARSWGVLSRDGTPLAEVCKPGFVSVMDISFLEENVASLVIGMLARKILAARKLVTRKEAAGSAEEEKDVEEVLDVDIPPTWLIIDEAHTLIPSGGRKTAATDALIEYVKQGRRPGCSLVFATQQPSAIDSRVMSQLDLILCHKLVFDEDLHAVMKRMPTLVPPEYEKSRFLKTLPIGIALVGDRSESTSRAFCLEVRPRYSQHEGREAVMDIGAKASPEKVVSLATSLVYKKLQTAPMSLVRVEEACDALSSRYKVKVDTSAVLKALQAHGCVIDDGTVVSLPGVVGRGEENEGQVNSIVAQAPALRVTESEARRLAEKMRQRKSLGLFGAEETVSEVRLVREPLYRVSFNLPLQRGFKELYCYCDENGELYYWEKGLRRTTGLAALEGFDERRLRVLKALRKPADVRTLAKHTSLTAQGLARILADLGEAGLIEEQKKGVYRARKLDVPDTLDEKRFLLDDFAKFEPFESGKGDPARGKSGYERYHSIPKLYGGRPQKVEKVLRPVWRVTFAGAKGDRVEMIEAI